MWLHNHNPLCVEAHACIPLPPSLPFPQPSCCLSTSILVIQPLLSASFGHLRPFQLTVFILRKSLKKQKKIICCVVSVTILNVLTHDSPEIVKTVVRHTFVTPYTLSLTHLHVTGSRVYSNVRLIFAHNLIPSMGGLHLTLAALSQMLKLLTCIKPLTCGPLVLVPRVCSPISDPHFHSSAGPEKCCLTAMKGFGKGHVFSYPPCSLGPSWKWVQL